MERPTAIPSTPRTNNKGNFTGKLSGSFFLPSYDSFHWVVLSLKSVSKANFESLASI